MLTFKKRYRKEIWKTKINGEMVIIYKTQKEIGKTSQYEIIYSADNVSGSIKVTGHTLQSVKDELQKYVS